VAGFSLLALIFFALVSNLFVNTRIIVAGDVVKTAENILDHEKLFRAGIACTLMMFNCDIVEAVALYILLKPVGKNLALLGMVWRFANACIGGSLTLGSFFALRLAVTSGPLFGLSPVESRSLIMLFLDPSNEGGFICLTFFSFGMITHGYLFLKSNYIPRILSGLYVFAAAVLLVGTFSLIVFPGITASIFPAYIIPDFLAELFLGLWLSIKGVKIPDHVMGS